VSPHGRGGRGLALDLWAGAVAAALLAALGLGALASVPLRLAAAVAVALCGAVLARERLAALWRARGGHAPEQPEEALRIRDTALATCLNGIAFAGADGRLTWVNAAFCRMWRCKVNEALGESAEGFWADPEAAAEVIRSTFGGGTWSGELVARRQDHSTFEVEVAASLVRDDAGSPLCLMGFFVDSSARQQAEAALRTRLRYEEALARCAEILQGNDAAENHLVEVLAELRGASGAARVRLLENVDDPQQGPCFAVAAEVSAPGVEPPPGHPALQFLPHRLGFDRWAGCMGRGEPVSGPVGGFPAAEREVLAAHGIGSMLAIPVPSGQGWYGLVAFDDADPAREWAAEDVRLLTAVAQMVGAWIERRRSQQALQQSEERYRSLAEAANDVIWIIDRDGVVRYANRFAAARFGVRPEELVGRRSDSLFPTDVASSQAGSLQRVLSEGKPLYAERRTPFPGGDMWLGTWLAPVRGADGTPQAVLGIARDITDRVRAEERLRESEARYRSMMEAMDDLVYICSEDYRIEYMNPAMVRRTGRDATGELCYPALHDRDEACPWCPREVFEGRRPARWEVESPKDGRTYSVANSPIVHVDGSVSKMAVIRDVTEIRRAEQERRQLEAQVQQAQKLESLGVMAGGIAHDFNNLLMAVLGNVELALLESPAWSGARPHLDEIATAARRGADLCGQMLTYAGRRTAPERPVDLTGLVEGLRRMLEVSVSKKVLLRFDLAPDLPAVVGDPTQLRQVLVNLVVNASEATVEGAGEVVVRTRVAECREDELVSPWGADPMPGGRYAALEVADTGCGMDEETRARMFEPFFTTKLTGRGLGLAATLGIVRGHGGTLHVDSEPGRGTLVRVLLPAARVQAVAEEEAAPAAQALRGHGRVLVVDDEEEVLAVCAAMVERLGFEVVTAADGRSAVETFNAASESFVAVLLDLTMPGLDGLEALREMRRTRPEVRVVLASGFPAAEIAERLAAEPPAAFLQKPYTMGTLAAALEATVRG